MPTAPHAERQVPAGTVLFRQGDVGGEMYIIGRGRVRLTLIEEGSVAGISVLGPGDFFGELSLLSGAPRTATADVLEDATLSTIGRDAFAILMQDDLDVVFRMMNVIGRRLSDANDRLRHEMRRVEQMRVFVHCLRRCLAAADAAAGFELEQLATMADVGVSRVRALVDDLAARGVGRVRDGCWVLDPNDTNRLADALAECLAR